MGIAYNPRMVADGMVLYLDAANPKNFNLNEVEVLVVAGGGAGGGYGGNDGAGGGGAGGLIHNRNFTVTPGSALTVTVGGGGAGVGGAVRGNSGGNSVFGSLTAIGGGGGGSEGALEQRPGGSGGSGGGGGGYGAATGAGGNGTAGQGNVGGNCTAPGDGGGGGAGSAGESGLTGKGGDGLGINISGIFTYYAGGGGASGDKRNARGGGGALGGLGGGGKGQDATNSTPPENGSPNTGGGGGAAAGSNPTYGAGTTLTSGAGGSGIVIVRYQGPQKAIGGTVTSINGDTIHTFTTSSTFTPLVATNNSAVLGLSDLSGNGNFGTTVNSPVYSSANGGSLSFDGTDEYATISGSGGWGFGGNGTIEQWVYVNGNDGANNRFWCVNNNSSSIDAYLNGSTYNIGFHGGAVLTTTTIPQGYWVHFVVTYTSGTIKVYFNTIEQGLTGTTTGYNITNNGTLNLGSFIVPGYELNGRISSMKIYNRALTASEVQQNYNALKSRYI